MKSILLPFLLATTLTTSSATNVTFLQPSVPLAPSPLPPSHPQADGEAIIALFLTLSRTTTWISLSNTTFQSPGYTFEPEGIVRLGSSHFVVSAGAWTIPTVTYGNGSIINGTDRTLGAGFAHFLVYTSNGALLADATLTVPGETEYHTGGIDFDGEFVWTTLAEYRPNSTAHIVRINPSNMQQETVMRVRDHQGAIVHDSAAKTLHTLNWGSRKEYTFSLPPTSRSDSLTPPIQTVRNPAYFIDYQDCKLLRSSSNLPYAQTSHSAFPHHPSLMLCSGIASLGTFYLGGLALVDVHTMTSVAEIPITLKTDAGVPLTVNLMEVSVENGKLRLYWLPGVGESVLRVYEAEPGSSF